MSPPTCPRCGGATDPDWYCGLGFCPACCLDDEGAESPRHHQAHIRLATGRYQTWRLDHGVPVRTTVSLPRFWRHPELEFARLLAPLGGIGRFTGDEARDAYLARLDQRADEVVGELADIARRHPGRRLCLLCYEDVHAGEECHRRWAAEWLWLRYGLDVPELPDQDDQPRLF